MNSVDDLQVTLPLAYLVDLVEAASIVPDLCRDIERLESKYEGLYNLYSQILTRLSDR